MLFSKYRPSGGYFVRMMCKRAVIVGKNIKQRNYPLNQNYITFYITLKKRL